MGQAGEDRHLDETSDDETDEEDEESEDEDEDVTGSEDEDDDDEDDEDEDDDDDDDDDDEDVDKNGNGDDANKFQDEPKTPINASSNIVEDYGVEGVPGDEDLEKGERPKTSEEDSQRSKKTLGLLCCCGLILAIIAIVLGVTLGKKDDESTTTSRAAITPSPAPVPSPAPAPVPVTPAPIAVTLPPKTDAPTANSPEYTIPASSDSYIFVSGGEEGPFGQEETLLVQRMDSGESLALLNFDIPVLPSPEVLDLSAKAFLVLTLFEENGRALQGNATMEDTATMDGNTTMEDNGTLTSNTPLFTLKTGLISGYSGDIEAITSNSSSLLEQLNRTEGPSFQILPGMREISVDITELLFSSGGAESPDEGIVLRRLQMPGSSKILLDLMADDADGNSGSVRFYSSQSSSPPRIEIDLPVTTGDCPICGEGNNVTYPEMELDLPQLGNVTCGELEYIASTGVVSGENCALLQPFVHDFCCENADNAKIFVCNLCSDGGNITNPTTILSIDGQDNLTCGEYQGLGMQGLIPTELCVPLQLLADEVCCVIEL